MDFEQRLRERPLPYVVPCHGCRFAKKENETYYYCRFFELTGTPRPYWVETPRPGRIIGRNTVKQVEGPFADDAEHHQCAAREPK